MVITEYGQYIMPVIEWGIVPLILIGLFIFALALSPNNPGLKTSTTAGKLGGFILFVLFVASQKEHAMSISFTLPNYGISWLPLLSSAIVCFCFYWMLDDFLDTRAAGVIALFLISATLITVYAYVFLASYRPMIVFLSLGGTFGVLMEVLVFEIDPIPAKKP